MLDRRRHPRTQLHTQVCVTHENRIHELEAVDASESGLFLEADPVEFPEFEIGAEVNVRIFQEDTGEDEDVLAMARVVRIEKRRGLRCSGFALEFIELGDEDERRLGRLIARFQRGRASA